MLRTLTILTLTLAAAAPGDDDPPVAQDEASAGTGLIWDARTVEHLYNRAGFGASSARIEAGIEKGPEACVAELLDALPGADPYLIEGFLPSEEDFNRLSGDERRGVLLEAQRKYNLQLAEYKAWWVERMLSSDDPLRDRMTLFWHGFFTTSAKDVTRSDKLLRQHRLLRDGALGSYADLLRGIAHDPAMLEYLDNEDNRKQSPNENFARELMELFSLGEGNYTETDVKEAARALTGWRGTYEGEFEFRRRDHDSGEKTVLGVTGRLTGDKLIDILLAQEACPNWVAGQLLEYFEGRAPGEERLARYSKLLRDEEFEIKAFLRTLFLDPEFYSDEIIGARVQSPLDYLIGSIHRLGVEPPPTFIVQASSALGQRLFEPPSVKGWDEGEGWITTSTLMLRGNLVGMLLGVVDLEMLVGEIDEMTDEATDSARRRFARELQSLRKFGESRYRPRINLIARAERTGATSDVQVVDFLIEELLATEVSGTTRRLLLEFLTAERAGMGLEDGALVEGGAAAEKLLRRLAHLILSLPEAQLG